MKHRLAALAAVLLLLSSAAEADDAPLWRALAGGGHVAIMRHATAPGIGDPQNFKLGDCATQRNLNDAGRAEARAVGERFRQAGVAVARVVTSQWCRARDTATGLALGPVTEDARLNSFLDSADRSAEIEKSKAALRDAARGGAVWVLVTHQVNITALTGVYPASGEIVVAKTSKSGAVEVVGTIKP